MMNIINKYKFGEIIVDECKYNSDIIIFPNFVKDNWRRKNSHQLSIKDLFIIINYKPDLLIIGTGMFGLMRVNNEVIQILKEKGIKKIFIKKTKQACMLYNMEKAYKKIAALHITC